MTGARLGRAVLLLVLALSFVGLTRAAPAAFDAVASARAIGF